MAFLSLCFNIWDNSNQTKTLNDFGLCIQLRPSPLSVYLFVHLSVGLFYIVLFSMKLFTFCTFFSIKQYITVYICLFVQLSVCLFVCLSVCLFVCLSVCLFVCLSKLLIRPRNFVSACADFTKFYFFLFCIFHCLVSGDQPDKDRDFLRHSPFSI